MKEEVAGVQSAGARSKNAESFAEFLQRAEPIDKDFKFERKADNSSDTSGSMVQENEGEAVEEQEASLTGM